MIKKLVNKKLNIMEDFIMDAVGSINQLLYEIVKWGQMLALPISAIAFLAGGILQMTGGSEGGRKARPWYIGSAIGLDANRKELENEIEKWSYKELLEFAQDNELNIEKVDRSIEAEKEKEKSKEMSM